MDWNGKLSDIQLFTGNRHTERKPCTEEQLQQYIQHWRTRASRISYERMLEGERL